MMGNLKIRVQKLKNWVQKIENRILHYLGRTKNRKKIKMLGKNQKNIKKIIKISIFVFLEHRQVLGSKRW